MTWRVVVGPNRVEVRAISFDEATQLVAVYEEQGRSNIVAVDQNGTEWSPQELRAAVLLTTENEA